MKDRDKKYTPEELLRDLGFEIINPKSEYPKDNIRKIVIEVELWENGMWSLCSTERNASESGDLGYGKNLLKMLPLIRECRDLFLKVIKEEKNYDKNKN